MSQILQNYDVHTYSQVGWWAGEGRKECGIKGEDLNFDPLNHAIIVAIFNSMQENSREGHIEVSHSAVLGSSLHVHFDSNPSGVQC